MISRRLLWAAIAAMVLSAASGSPAFAHSGGEASGISVEPAQVTAGGTVVLAGDGLEPDSERQINLVGPDVIVPFDTVTTDAASGALVGWIQIGTIPAGTADHAYDPAGNRATKTAGGTTTTYTYDDASRLTAAGAATYTYDAAGHRLTGGGSTFTWDQLGRLASATAGGDGRTRSVASTITPSVPSDPTSRSTRSRSGPAK